ncbi:hypothetical protein Tco_0901399 [Tanacetum coccineum]
MLPSMCDRFRKGDGTTDILPLIEFSYNNSYHTSIKAAPFERCMSQMSGHLLVGAELGDANSLARKCSCETKLRRLSKSSIVYKLHVIDKRATLIRDKCLSDKPLAILLDEIHIDEKLNFIEEPVEIMDREVKCLKQSRIPIVKFHWNSRRVPEYTWERKDQMQKKYPHLFVNPVSASQATS